MIADLRLVLTGRMSLPNLIRLYRERHRVEYHVVLCYLMPTPEGGFDPHHRTSILTTYAKTRSQIYSDIRQGLADVDGVTDMVVTFFSVEPNRLEDSRG